ncbi:histone deacetylase family protein [Desulfosudis oleivorans]|uniref:Histone deacetylase superfamily n=1 Tax=Desulfosudis oleivorans (strain DSM 6200 / JCM 39069 / Hxd3) TaxID=96561 RepID=A8ZT95_DESOH|nr:histone deacetylase [Desulfosudis oleivorans]ABW67778.1 histone deacetylase superfamily [Desulfosudis oleivorans Hxd3]
MSRKVAISRDDRFLLHKTGHAHPESPSRLASIYRMVDRHFAGTVTTMTPEPATLDQLELVHTPGHVKKILKTAEHKITSMAPDTPVSGHSYLAAWLAAGACMQGVDLLLSGACRAFFSLVRPPGHHALPDRATGFCLLNNLAIAARYARMRYNLERILIVDWDVHHGNGIHDIFYREPGVFYVSSHDLMLFPYSGEAGDTGEAGGRGFTLNMPLSRSFGDGDMAYIYRTVLTPVFRWYTPSMVMIAAGFDAHADDPLGRSAWSENAYFLLARLVCELADADHVPLLLSLEGGYDPGANAASAKAVLEALVSYAPAGPVPAPLDPNAADELLETVFTTHKPYGIVS